MAEDQSGSGNGARNDEREALMRLASMAAHQLKSPLNSVQVALDTVIGGFLGPLEQRQRDMLGRASESCHRGIRLVSDVMRLRRLDEIHSDDLSPVDLAASLRSAIERIRDSADEQRLELVEDLEVVGARSWVLGEATMLEETLFVLLDNAVRYTPAEGRVTVGLHTDGDAGQHVQVAVTDTGIGIPDEARDQVLTDFYRAPNAKRARQDGTGLGLPFAARALDLMGGELVLDEAPGGGTRATVRLPSRPDLAALQPEEPVPEGREVSRRVVVVGGVTAGSKVAARVMRLDPQARVTVVERGRLLTYAGCGLPYYVGGTVSDQHVLTSTAAGVVRDSAFFHSLKNVTALDLTEAESIDRDRRTVTIRRLTDGSRTTLHYDALVLATGAITQMPSAPGVELDGVLTLQGVDDAEAIRARLRTPAAAEVVIVGAGLLGCEMAESIVRRGARLTMVEQQGSILGIVDPEMAVHVRRHIEARGVKVIVGHRAVRFEGGDRVEAVVLDDGRRIPCDFTILATGVKPSVELAVGCGLELGPTGAVRVDRQQRTSDPSVWAVGDCAEDHHLILDSPWWVPSGSNALKQGRVAAGAICGRDEVFRGVFDSWVLKVFELNVATTGLTERAARAAGFDVVTALLPGPDRAHYLPTSRNVLVKLVADRATGRVLGAQGVGEGEVAKRVEVVATALAGGLDLDELASLDLPYAPPYSLGMDPVIAAANVLRNKRDGMVDGISPLELSEKLVGDEPPLLLDVRLSSEYEEHRLAGSAHVPLGALRGRLSQFSADREIVTVCSLGLRSYEAARLFAAHGYPKVRMLDGGLAAWPYELEHL